MDIYVNAVVAFSAASGGALIALCGIFINNHFQRKRDERKLKIEKLESLHINFNIHSETFEKRLLLLRTVLKKGGDFNSYMDLGRNKHIVPADDTLGYHTTNVLVSIYCPIWKPLFRAFTLSRYELAKIENSYIEMKGNVDKEALLQSFNENLRAFREIGDEFSKKIVQEAEKYIQTSSGSGLWRKLPWIKKKVGPTPAPPSSP